MTSVSADDALDRKPCIADIGFEFYTLLHLNMSFEKVDRDEGLMGCMVDAGLRHTGDIFTNVRSYMGEEDSLDGQLGEPYAMAIMFANESASPATPNEFFAWAWGGMKAEGLMIFLSQDEGTLGRCSCVQMCHAKLAITLVHSRAADILEKFLEIESDDFVMYRFDSVHMRQNADCMRARDEGDGAAEQAAVDAMEAALVTCATQLTEKLIEAVSSTSMLAQCGEANLPNLRDVLRDARGPIEKVSIDLSDVSTPPASLCRFTACTVMGGYAAIVYLEEALVDDQALAIPSFLDATVAIVVSPQQAGCLPEVQVTCQQSKNRTIVHARGVPVAQVAYVLDDVISAAGKFLRNSNTINVDFIKFILEEACIPEICAHIVENTVSKRHLMHALRRCVRANLESIKTRLWAPGAPLMRRWFDGEMQREAE